MPGAIQPTGYGQCAAATACCKAFVEPRATNASLGFGVSHQQVLQGAPGEGAEPLFRHRLAPMHAPARNASKTQPRQGRDQGLGVIQRLSNRPAGASSKHSQAAARSIPSHPAHRLQARQGPQQAKPGQSGDRRWTRASAHAMKASIVAAPKKGCRDSGQLFPRKPGAYHERTLIGHQTIGLPPDPGQPPAPAHTTA